MAEEAASIILSVCNSCGRETEHDVSWKDTTTVKGPDFASETRYLAVRCRGCKESALREELWYFDYTPPEDADGSLVRVSYSPVRLWRRPPEWLGALETLDADLKGLLDEVYSAANDQQIRLLSMGVRAALDHVMTKILGADIGGFEKKLDEMVVQGHLTKKQRDNMGIVVDAGSASTHRGYKPARQLLDEMVAVMENIIRDHYITGPMLNTAKMHIPPRPPLQKK